MALKSLLQAAPRGTLQRREGPARVSRPRALLSWGIIYSELSVVGTGKGQEEASNKVAT